MEVNWSAVAAIIDETIAHSTKRAEMKQAVALAERMGAAQERESIVEALRQRALAAPSAEVRKVLEGIADDLVVGRLGETVAGGRN